MLLRKCNISDCSIFVRGRWHAISAIYSSVSYNSLLLCPQKPFKMITSVEHLTKKRQKKQVQSPKSAAGPSQQPSSSGRLFAPFRALGYVTDHVPFAMFVHTLNGALATPTVNITTSVGRSWLMWDASRMTLVFAGSCHSWFLGLTLIFESQGLIAVTK